MDDLILAIEHLVRAGYTLHIAPNDEPITNIRQVVVSAYGPTGSCGEFALTVQEALSRVIAKIAEVRLSDNVPPKPMTPEEVEASLKRLGIPSRGSP
jgi:hypothetical protein